MPLRALICWETSSEVTGSVPTFPFIAERNPLELEFREWMGWKSNMLHVLPYRLTYALLFSKPHHVYRRVHSSQPLPVMQTKCWCRFKAGSTSERSTNWLSTSQRNTTWQEQWTSSQLLKATSINERFKSLYLSFVRCCSDEEHCLKQTLDSSR